MKRFLCLFLSIIMLSMQTGAAFAIQDARSAQTKQISYVKNARTITYAFVFDGPSDKNKAFLTNFQKSITANTAPYYKTSFPNNLVYTGDWTQNGVKAASDKALNSNATVVVSLGYLSTKYYNSLKSKKKFVITIDQYGLKDFSDGFFNPIRQSANGINVFKRLVHFNKAAVLINDSYYKTRSNWDAIAKQMFPDTELAFIPVKNDAAAVLNAIPADCDAVIFTPLYNLATDKKKMLIETFNEQKLPTYSTVGREDVEMGVLFGSGAIDVDQKVADATAFSIRGVLNGNKNLNGSVSFYEDQVLFVNKDTAEQIGHQTHLRVLSTAEVISSKKPELYTLGTIFDKLASGNFDYKKSVKKVQAARRSSVAAMLRYLPTFGITLGYQQYNDKYAESAKLLYPEKTGVFSMGIEQVIYSPELVTNILVKAKQVNFQKAEKLLTEQSVGLEVAQLYVETLMLENLIQIQKEYVKESREDLAIARVREKMGKCGPEEGLRWAAQLNTNERKLVEMNAELDNLKININELLGQQTNAEFELAELKATDPAFYTSQINLVDYLTTEAAIEKFTQMLIKEAYRVSPELAKLKAAIKMKQYEMAMYYQKFILPSAKLSYDYTALLHPHYAGNVSLYQPTNAINAGGAAVIPASPADFLYSLPHSNKTNGKFGIYAQWKPIEGGTKIAEIARTKAELDELHIYDEQVREMLDAHIRNVINTALADYIVIEKKYKSMYAAKMNYQLVKKAYLEGDKTSIAQLTDAQDLYLNSKADAINSQYEFFKQLLWVQRGICAVDWRKASPESKKFIQDVKDAIEVTGDVQLL